MADSQITQGNPFINPTGWQQHPVDLEARRREFHEQLAAEPKGFLDFLFFSSRDKLR